MTAMEPSTTNSTIPLVVKLGFAGSRKLFPSSSCNDSEARTFEQSVEAQLYAILERLPEQLGLSGLHFLCGVSQIAIGGDFLFARVCESRGIVQQVFLPQPIDEYLVASGEDGNDFTPVNQAAVRGILESPRIIQIQVASDASDRSQRFSDTNLEIVSESDVILCLVREGQTSSPGGTLEVVEIAKRRGKPLLLATIHLVNGEPEIRTEWFNKERFYPPMLPEPLLHLQDAPVPEPKGEILTMSALPTARGYADHMRVQASRLAKRHKGFFKKAALIIISTHILATVCAVIGVQFYVGLKHLISQLLIAELLLLGFGFAVHHRLHRREASQQWAQSRLIAELSRSVVAVGRQHVDLEQWFHLPFPASLKPLLRTLNVLQLASTGRKPSADAWQSNRDTYLLQRLAGATGQINFYARESANAAKMLHRAHHAFNICSLGALLATFLKLTHLVGEPVSLILGPLAILLPVLAVAALSLAAAFDLEARHHTFGDMLHFLRGQHQLMTEVTTEREFCQLLIETESRLLGETVNWYSRRSFTGVA